MAMLMHGGNDNLIPYPESQVLAAVVPEAQARVFFIQSVFGHVDLSVSNLISWRFWRMTDLLPAKRGAGA